MLARVVFLVMLKAVLLWHWVVKLVAVEDFQPKKAFRLVKMVKMAKILTRTVPFVTLAQTADIPTKPQAWPKIPPVNFAKQVDIQVRKHPIPSIIV